MALRFNTKDQKKHKDNSLKPFHFQILKEWVGTIIPGAPLILTIPNIHRRHHHHHHHHHHHQELQDERPGGLFLVKKEA
ncbi:Protein of unknown function [Gryllus bimaculatus]|nr:Protein of unknown function [Gryllus bimaculatus]